MIERLKTQVTYCQRLIKTDAGYVEGVETFAPPETRWLRLRDTNGEAMLVTAGELKTGILVGKTFEPYKETSRLYIGKPPPEVFDPMCEDADYAVLSADAINRPATIMLQRLVADGA